MNGSYEYILLFHTVATLFMTGLIWFVQVVHYPLMGVVGSTVFTRYEQRHTALTTRVVAPVMIIEAVTGMLLVFVCPQGVACLLAWLGLVLLLVIWLSTVWLQVPCHRFLAEGFDHTVHRTLVASNWLRTCAWTTRAGIVVLIVQACFGASLDFIR